MNNTEFYGVFGKRSGRKRGGVYGTEGIARNVASGWDDENYGKRYEQKYPAIVECQDFEIRKLTPVLKAQDNGAFTLDMEWVRV